MNRREEVLRLFDSDPQRLADCVVGLEEHLEAAHKALHEIARGEWPAYDADGGRDIARIALEALQPRARTVVSTTTDEKLAAMIRRLSEQNVAMVSLISELTQAGLALEQRVAALEQSQDTKP